VTRDGDILTYAGLEPILNNSPSANLVIGLSNNDDIDAILSDAAGAQMTLAGSTFEGITFSNPASSLTIRGLDGEDTITVTSLDSGFNGDLTIEAEHIRISSGASINLPGKNVTLKAIATNSNSRVMSVDVTVEADVTAATLEITAQTQGSVVKTGLVSATNNFSETATASISNATITVDGLVMSATTGTSYRARAPAAYNRVTGDVKAFIEGSTVIAGVGGVALSATDNTTLSAESPEKLIDLGDAPPTILNLGLASGRNELTRNVEAFITGSSVTTTAGSNGDVTLRALRNAKMITKAETVTIAAGVPVIQTAITMAGTLASNVLLGDVKAYIADNSTVTTDGTGDILLDARDT